MTDDVVIYNFLFQLYNFRYPDRYIALDIRSLFSPLCSIWFPPLSSSLPMFFTFSLYVGSRCWPICTFWPIYTFCRVIHVSNRPKQTSSKECKFPFSHFPSPSFPIRSFLYRREKIIDFFVDYSISGGGWWWELNRGTVYSFPFRDMEDKQGMVTIRSFPFEYNIIIQNLPYYIQDESVSTYTFRSLSQNIFY